MTDIDTIIDTLGCSLAEAEQMAADDAIIDAGGRLDWEMSEKEERKIREENAVKVSRKVRAKETGARKRQPNIVKQNIINTLYEAILALDANATVTNPERSISISIGDLEFGIDVTQHKKKTTK